MDPVQPAPSWGVPPGAGEPEEGYFQHLLRRLGPSGVEAQSLAPPADRAVVARVASTPTQRRAAAALVEQRYAWRGYLTEVVSRWTGRSRRDEFVLVALADDGRVMGTVTLGLDGPAGLWIDGTYPAEAARLRARGATLCELTRLAVAPGEDTRIVLAALFDLAYAKGRGERGATDLLVEVNPRHAPLYRRLFGFSVASSVRECGRVKAPAVLLHMDIARLDASRVRYLAQQAGELPDLAVARASESATG